MEIKFNAWMVLVVGIVLLLPKIGISILGDLTTGFLSWLIPIAVIAIGIMGLIETYKR